VDGVALTVALRLGGLLKGAMVIEIEEPWWLEREECWMLLN
jgi:hypothetical protein